MCLYTENCFISKRIYDKHEITVNIEYQEMKDPITFYTKNRPFNFINDIYHNT